jgi:PspAA-like protein
VIVRILGEGQWEVPDESLDGLNELDDRVEQAVSKQDQGALALALSELLDEVRALGSAVPDDQILDSDLILPDVDSSLADVESLLAESSEGLIPG